MSDKIKEFRLACCPNCTNVFSTETFSPSYNDLKAKHEKVLEMLRIAEQGLKDAEFVFEGSVAIDGQSDEILYKRSRAVERFLKALSEIERLKNENT